LQQKREETPEASGNAEIAGNQKPVSTGAKVFLQSANSASELFYFSPLTNHFSLITFKTGRGGVI
jgi:hypothetical protein